MLDRLRLAVLAVVVAEYGDHRRRGTLLSRQQYLIDVERRGYIDPRTLPDNPMTDDEIATWTAGIRRDGSP